MEGGERGGGGGRKEEKASHHYSWSETLASPSLVSRS